MEIYNLKSPDLPRGKRGSKATGPGGEAGLIGAAESGVGAVGAGLAGAQTITAMKPAVKNPNRVNVYLDGEYSFSLDLAQVVDYKLKVGQAVSAEQLAEYQRASERGKLYQRTLEWVLTRPHSVRETRDYLRRRQAKRRAENNLYERRQAENRSAGWHQTDNAPHKRQTASNPPRQRSKRRQPHKVPEILDEDIEWTLARLAAKGYLDDAKFVQYYLENRFIKKGISAKRLRLELAQKGIAPELVEAALTDGGRDEVAEIRKMIAKKAQRYDTPDKLVAYLVRQGFPYQLASEEVALYTGEGIC